MTEWWKVVPFLCMIISCKGGHKQPEQPPVTPTPVMSKCAAVLCAPVQQCSEATGKCEWVVCPSFGEDGLWTAVEGALHEEKTRDLIREVQREFGDTTGMENWRTNERYAEWLLQHGHCAAVMGGDRAEIFIMIPGQTKSPWLYEQWHAVHAGTGAVVTSAQKGVWLHP